MSATRNIVAVLPGLVLLAWAPLASGAPLSLRIDTDSVAINEYFQLTLQVNARHVQLVIPATEDFRVVDATSPFDQPMFCMNMGTSVISGPCVFRFRLYPNRAGKLTVPEFKIVDDFFDPGRVVGQSEPLDVTVSDKPADSPKSKQQAPNAGQRKRGGRRGMQPQNPQAMRTGGPSTPEPTDTLIAPADLRNPEQFAAYDIFLLPVIQRDFVYLNEPFGVDFVLYVAENSGASGIQGLELPDLDGFRKEEVSVQQNELPGTILGGRRYQAFLLARYVLLPMEAGKRTLTAATATVLASSSSYQQFGGGGFAITFSSGSQPLEVSSPPLALEVREAPAPAPAEFEPANIGRFTLGKLEVPPPQPAGSWVVLKYEIAGDGNLLTLALPELSVHPDIETRSSAVDNDGVKL
ncbi:MAG: protein BatD, partial [Deltaproteobacteria bacterium]|nr:protein BatD [Deltaproteobacteria bacterium]